jgi:DNA-binding response OmpR family regulator
MNTDLRNSLILVVEDDEADTFLLRRAFRAARIANPVIDVKDGAEAIEYFSGLGVYADRARFPVPALLLLDLRLPKLSGFEVLEWIRDRHHLNEVVIVILTASEDVGHVNRAYELGAKSYLVKPGTFEELVEVVRQLTGPWLTLENRPKPSIEPDSTT